MCEILFFYGNYFFICILIFCLKRTHNRLLLFPLLYRLPRDELKKSLRSGRACKFWPVELYWFFSILVDFNFS